jgi:hypothetical protein
MDSSELDKELREIGAAIAGLEIATWAAMRAIFETNPEAAELLQSTYPALLGGLSGEDATDVKERVERHMRRWLPT